MINPETQASKSLECISPEAFHAKIWQAAEQRSGEVIFSFEANDRLILGNEDDSEIITNPNKTKTWLDAELSRYSKTPPESVIGEKGSDGFKRVDYIYQITDSQAVRLSYDFREGDSTAERTIPDVRNLTVTNL